SGRKNYQLEVNWDLIGFNSEITGINSEETPVNSGFSTQSKAKQSKTNQSKTEQSKSEETQPDIAACSFENFDSFSEHISKVFYLTFGNEPTSIEKNRLSTCSKTHNVPLD